MAITVTETTDSRRIATRDGLTTANRSFHVYDLETPILQPLGVYALFGSNGLPNYWDQFPDAAFALNATSVTVQRAEGQIDVWLVNWDYTEQSYNIVQLKNPEQPGYVDVSAEASGETVDAWRSLTQNEIAALTASGGPYSLGTPGATPIDIGGRPMDSAGEPLTKLIRQISVNYAVTVDQPPNILTFAPFIGTRNSKTFSGAAPGRCLYLGGNVSRTSLNRWSINHKFLLDEWAHMRQVAERNPDGQVILGSIPAGGVAASKVTFAQPFPDLADFFQISPFLVGFA
jgi:hypothetical protein